jgi:hypothetical protein
MTLGSPPSRDARATGVSSTPSNLTLIFFDRKEVKLKLFFYFVNSE